MSAPDPKAELYPDDDSIETLTLHPGVSTALQLTRSGVYEIADGRGGKRPRAPDPLFPPTFKIGKSRRIKLSHFRKYLALKRVCARAPRPRCECVRVRLTERNP